jgi:hypothetical protein
VAMSDIALPPWDRLAAFALPVETTYTLTGTPQLIAKGDPMRTLIVIALTGVNATNVSVVFPVPIAYSIFQVSVTLPFAEISTNPNFGSNQGFAITPVGYPFIIDAEHWGAAVAAPWYAIGSTVTPPRLTVLTVSMTRWPEDPAGTDLIKEADSGKWKGIVAGRANRTGPVKQYGHRWSERKAISPYDIAYYE